MGHVTVGRRYYACASCGAKRVPFDAWAGLGRRSLTEAARRLVTLAGTSWPFDRASRHLKELCRLDVSDDTIERVCQEEGERARKWLGESDAPPAAFAKAKGVAEFYTDGVSVNTVGGWREMKLSVLAKREPTTPAGPGGWDERALNEPSAKWAWCVIGGCGRVGASWRRAAGRAGLGDSAELSVIADGARWIWDQAAKRLSPNAEWCVDVFHVSQHLHGCAKAMLGEGQAARDWADGRLAHLLEDGGPGTIRRLEADRAALAEADDAARDAMGKLLGYLRDNADSLWYKDRLARGLPIGSGLIEGACKNAIGARLKANAARWRIRRVERVGALRCLDYSGHWDTFWKAVA